METKLYFNNLSSALLYKFELEGQISDGKYENTRPYDHWRWVIGSEVIIDDKYSPCSTGSRWHYESMNKKYNLREWPGYWKNGNPWAFRAMQYVRLGRMFESTQKNYDELTSAYEIRSAVENFPVNKPDDYNVLKVIAEKSKAPQWFIDMIDDAFCNKFYNGSETPREISKMWKEAHESMKETVNTRF